jgi:hypothetical protein
MADRGNYGGREGGFIECLPSCGATYSTAAGHGGVHGDGMCRCGWTAGEEFPDGSHYAGGQISVPVSAAHLLALAPGRTLVGVLKAFFSAVCSADSSTTMPWRS